jgi:hypothetical protein
LQSPQGIEVIVNDHGLTVPAGEPLNHGNFIGVACDYRSLEEQAETAPLQLFSLEKSVAIGQKNQPVTSPSPQPQARLYILK